MGQTRKARRAAILASCPGCVFCGALKSATTIEHCPPRSLFLNREGPEDFEFGACNACNGGSSNHDLAVAFLANLRTVEGSTPAQSVGLMKSFHRQHEGVLEKMLIRSPVKARRVANSLGLVVPAGLTYVESGIVAIPDEIDTAVANVSAKLIRALYFKHLNKVLPDDAGVMFWWFTNADVLTGAMAPLYVLAPFAHQAFPVRRGRVDLREQFEYGFNSDDAGRFHVLKVKFGDVFGFVSIFSHEGGYLENLYGELEAKWAAEDDAGSHPWRWLSGGGGWLSAECKASDRSSVAPAATKPT